MKKKRKAKRLQRKQQGKLKINKYKTPKGFRNNKEVSLKQIQDMNKRR